MKNFDYCKYTYAHKKIIEFMVRKYIKEPETKSIMIEKMRNHDMDKLTSYLFYPKKVASKNHRDNISHHVNNDIVKNKYDYIEMVFDWESARYTKPDKPLNAYDTLYKYYPELEGDILPLLKEYGLDKPNTSPDKDVSRFAKTILNDITEDDIINEVVNFIKRLK